MRMKSYLATGALLGLAVLGTGCTGHLNQASGPNQTGNPAPSSTASQAGIGAAQEARKDAHNPQSDKSTAVGSGSRDTNGGQLGGPNRDVPDTDQKVQQTRQPQGKRY